MSMSGGKQRHGCLTAWLILMIIVNALTAVVNLAAAGFIRERSPGMPAWAMPVLAVGAALNVVFAIALFLWKKWGFYGVVVMTVIAFVVNVASGINIALAVFGLVGVGVLYGVLQIGRENKGWPQLE
jgi:small-conductance mechanosensitive channel